MRCVLPLYHGMRGFSCFLSRVPADLQSCVNVQAHPHNGPPPSPTPLPPSRHCSSLFFFFISREKMLECPFSFCSSAFISFCHPISRLLLCFWHHLVSRTVRSNVPVVLPECVFNIPLSRNPPGGRENDDYDGIENGTKKKSKTVRKSKKKKKKRRGGPQSAAWQRATLFLKTVGWLCPPISRSF